MTRNDGYGMKSSPSSKFLPTLENKFHVLLHSLKKMRYLIQRQSNLLYNDDFFHYNNTAKERRDLINAINLYNQNLVELKEEWPRFKKKVPKENQQHIQQIVQEVIHTTKQVIRLEGATHKLVRKSTPILEGGFNEQWKSI